MSKQENPQGTDRGDPESTFDLIDRARNGDQAAMDRLFARHLRPLQRWASGRLPKWARDLADTDDLVQDTLLQTFKRIGDFEPRRVGALQAYLRQAVVNRLRDELRRKGRRPESTDLDGVELTAAGTPLEEAIGREAVETYEQALRRLTPDEREAIIARVEMGYSYEELAQVLGKRTLLPLEKLDEAEPLLQAAVRTDPLSPTVHQALGFLKLVAGRFDEAIDHLERAKSLDPDSPYLDQNLLRALTFAGRLPEALSFIDTKADSSGVLWKDAPGGQTWMAFPYVMTGRRAEVEQMARVHGRTVSAGRDPCGARG